MKVVDVALNALKVNKQLIAKAHTHISRDFLVTYTGDEIEFLLKFALYLLLQLTEAFCGWVRELSDDLPQN